MLRTRSENNRPYMLPRPIKCDPDEVVTMEFVNKYIKKHENYLPRYEYLEALYEGFHDIFNDPEKPDWKPDYRLAVNFPRYITESFVGYGYGIPIKVISDNDQYAEALQAFEDVNEMDDHNAELCRICCMYGHGWEYFYQDEEAVTRVSEETPRDLFVIYENSLKHRAFAMIRYGRHEDESRGVYGEIATREQIWTFDKGVLSEPQENVYGFIPCVEWQLNSSRKGLYEDIAGMNELYNRTLSEKGNDVAAFAEAYLVVLGAELDEDGIYRIRDNRLINLYGTDNAKDIVVNFLTKPTADGTQENLLDRLEKLIFLTSMTANFSDETFGTAVSGTALAYKLLNMDDLTKVFNRKIKKSIKKRCKIFSSLVTNVPESIAEEWKKIDVKFTVNLPKNLKEEAEIAKTLDGVTSKATQLQVLSVVSDPDAEIEAIREEEQQAAGTALQALESTYRTESDN